MSDDDRMGRPTSRPLVGRDDELAELLAVWTGAAAGRPGLALIGGDAGAGKSRLLAELVAAVQGSSARSPHQLSLTPAVSSPAGSTFTPAAEPTPGGLVLVGACVQVGDLGVPYLPVVDALRALERDPAGLELLTLEASRRPALARLLPHLVPGPVTDEPPADGLSQGQLFEAVHRLLSGMGEVRPVLLVLEDVHWADAGTRDLLAFLARTLRSGRVAIAVTYRTDDMHRRHPLRPLLAELARLPQVSRLTVGPLSRDELAVLLDDLTGEPVDPAVIEAIHRRSEGNAFFAEELARTCDRRAGLRAGLLVLPDDLADLLLTRVEAIPEAGREAMRLAAVAGRPVTSVLLCAVAGSTAEQVEAGLRHGVEAGLLVADGQRYAFRHALLREAVYADLLPGERVRMHGRFARELQAGTTAAAAELAHHRLLALDLPGALSALVDAAGEAERLGAAAEALRHLEQAIELLERLGSGADIWDLVTRAGEAAMASGDQLRAARHGEAAVDEADRRGQVQERAAARERLARYLLEYDPGDDDAQGEVLGRAGEIAGQAADLLAGLPPSGLLARSLATRARAYIWADPPLGVRLLDEALAAAETAGEQLVAAGVLVSRALLARRGVLDADPAALLADAVTRAGTGVGGVHIRLRALRFRSAQLAEDGDQEQALEVADRGIAGAADAGLTWSGWGLDLMLMRLWVLEAMGRWSEVSTDAGAALYAPSRTARVLATVAVGVMIGQGHPDAPALLARLRGTGDFYCELQLDLREADLWLSRGDPAAACALAERGLTRLNGVEGNTEAILLLGRLVAAHADLAVAERLTGRTRAAEAHAAAAVDVVHRMERAARSSPRIRTPYGALWQARIRTEGARAVGLDDADQWVDVATAAVRAGRVPEQMHAAIREITARLDHGARGAETVAAVIRARELAERLEARPMLDELAATIRRARLKVPEESGAGALGPGQNPLNDPPHDSRHGSAGPGAPLLTPREREVLALVAAGRSNRQIGRALAITDKTASVHVSNIMGKLGAASRTEAALAARRRGLLLDGSTSGAHPDHGA